MERRQNSIVPLSSVDIHRKEGRPFYIFRFHWEIPRLSATWWLSGCCWPDRYRRYLPPMWFRTHGSHCRHRRWNSFLQLLPCSFLYVHRMGYSCFWLLQSGLSVQFHISFVASEVGGIFHGGLGVQPYACSIGEGNLGPLSGRHSDCLQLHLLVI